MPHKVEDDWSDSDDEGLSDVETSVLLGVPDGPIVEAGDLADAAVSRIGGHPAFLTSEPPVSSAHCKACSNPMELLVQIWCPMEDSPMDRALYVWGCARSGCQRKEGSVRAWRNLRRNQEYAAKLEKKKKKEQARLAGHEAAKPVKPTGPKSNPFALAANSPAGPFGLGSQIFGAMAPVDPTIAEAAENTKTEEPSVEDEEDAGSVDEEEELVTAIAATTLEDSQWLKTPAYKALYLSTCSEYLPPASKSKLPSGVKVEDQDERSGGKDSGGFAPEGYENSLDTDHVFDRFSSRVAHEPEQCVRYELDGTPLPFGSDPVFDRLFPAPKPTSTFIGHDLSTTVAPKRVYSDASIPACPRCMGKRVFECQLMPNLINATTTDTKADKYANEEQRVEAVRASLQKGGAGRGMEWGTCFVFSCAADCCEGSGQFVEEIVLVQWED